MKKSSKIIIGTIGGIILIGFVLGVFGFLRGLENPQHIETTGTLRGTIMLGNGEPAQGIFNVVNNFITDEVYAQFGTDANGYFEIALPPGEYMIQRPNMRLGTQQHLVTVRSDEATDVSITFEHVGVYRNSSLGFSISHPASVYLVHEDDELVQFSTLPLDDPKQQSSVGLLSSLTIRHQVAPLIEGGEEVMIEGERVLVATEIGAYGGEAHREYFYPNRNLSVSYVAEPPQDTLFTKMVLSIRFEE